MLEMNQMLKIIVERDASDLHLHVAKPAVMRLHGILDVIDPLYLTHNYDDKDPFRGGHAY